MIKIHTVASPTISLHDNPGTAARFLLQIAELNTGCIKKKLNKPEIALRLCKAPQCTKFFIEIGCLGINNVV